MYSLQGFPDEGSDNMKIEKVNENQIRCTLTREDLAERQIKLSELAYGTEKAKMLFRDMLSLCNFRRKRDIFQALSGARCEVCPLCIWTILFFRRQKNNSGDSGQGKGGTQAPCRFQKPLPFRRHREAIRAYMRSALSA